MKYIYIVMLLVAVACNKNEPDMVEKFVQEVKAERFQDMTLPAFNVSHIETLMNHASGAQVVSNYPRPMHSSYYGGPVEVGLVMLYAIEAVRLQVDWPSLAVRVFDEHDLSREVPLGEVLPHYNRWWAANKGKNAAELKLTDPLENSGLTWQIYTKRNRMVVLQLDAKNVLYGNYT
ncbi:DUF4943 family protein [Parapedobacter sp. ISTM3]|uniref:DUF4943 family protein n=1 Tax=Parapedobacter sp. ISTM3 TaxID=2800130 RepID=UPI00190888AD|nr:DUF4943 family protein [Parapedobacter sp. ISTM3]MBK1442674.1 DUF4943 family protein [Parapedobacter sp. ISTM3]